MINVMRKTEQDNVIESDQRASLVNIFTHLPNPITYARQFGITSQIPSTNPLSKVQDFFPPTFDLAGFQFYRKAA